MNINIKKCYPNVEIPKKAHTEDAAFDLKAYSFSESDKYIEYGLGVSLEIPKGYCGLIFPRSSISNYDLVLCNSVGVIDSGYRGELKVRFKKTGDNIYEIGDRVCQLLIQKVFDFNFIESDLLDQQNNRNGGFGSTGK